MELVYTPAHINGHFIHFDDQVKLASTTQLTRHFSIDGKPATKDFNEKIYPNVLQEISVAFLYSPFVWLSGSQDAPYYALGLFVGLSYLCLFLLTEKWTGNIYLGFAVPFIIIQGYNYFSFDRIDASYFVDPLALLGNIRRITEASEYELNSFYRIHTLGASYFIFLLYIYQLYRVYQFGKLTLRNSSLLAFLLALTFYTYLFYSIAAAFIYVTGIIFYLVAGILSGKKDYTFIKGLFMAGVAALLLSLPSIINTVQLLLDQGSSDWLARISGPPSPEGYIFSATAQLPVYLAIIAICSPNNAFRIIGLALGFVTLIVENLDYLVGFNIQPGHLYMRATLPLMVVMAIAALYHVAGRIRIGEYKPACILFSIPVVGLGMFFMYIGFLYPPALARNTYNFQGITYDQAEFHEWVKENAGGKTFATLNPELAIPLNHHTNSYLYLYYAGHQYSSVKNEDIDRRLGIVFWLLGMGKAEIERYFDQESGNRVERRYHYYYWQRFFGYPRFGDNFDEVIDNFGQMIEQITLQPSRYLCPMPFEYLAIDRSRDRSSTFKQPNDQYLELKRTFGEIQLFQLKEGLCQK